MQYFTLLNVQKNHITKLLWILLETTNLNWRECTFYQEVSIDTSFVCFSIKFWIISFLTNCFSSSKKFHHHCVLFATLRMKHCCISSILVILQNDFGINFNILFLSIFKFLKLLHRVPTLEFLISDIKKRIFC